MDYTRPLRYEFPLLRGEDVRAVQQALLALHLDPPCGGADGVFGSMTEQAVRSFQQSYNRAGRGTGAKIIENGVVAQDTWAALFGQARDSSASAARIVAAAGAARTAATGTAVAETCLREAQVKRVRDWMAAHFAADIDAAAANIRVDSNLIYAIACQETAIVWLAWIDKMQPNEVLARCIFDASGDAPQTARKPFPANTSEFRTRYGEAVTQHLIEEANVTRRLRGFSPKEWVYKGYGMFQYDLQNIESDRTFFDNRSWWDMRLCLERLTKMLNDKLARAQGNLTEAVRAYNGAGRKADAYVASVMQMREWCA